MSLVTVTSKRKRVYRRKFDHEDALALLDAGWTHKAVAEKFGVSESRVYQIAQHREDPESRERDNAARNQWLKDNKRAPCAGGCGAMVWTHMKGRSGFCPSCVKSIGYVTDDELMCLHCREWKPDSEFSPGRTRGRRYRNSWCRACRAAQRREQRRAARERA